MTLKEYRNVKNIFNKISYRYDFLNNLLSFGLHNVWKKKLVNLLKPMQGENWADLCCGTGDLSFLIEKKIRPYGSILGVDNANEILEIARKKSQIKGNKLIKWETADILKIDNKNKFDGICMSYGLRNLHNIEEGIYKVFNLLDVRGRAGFLDFNHSKVNSFSYFFQTLYLRLIVVPVSKIFRLNKEYSYIEESIRNFPDGDRLLSIAKKIGFKKANYLTIFGGQMGILILKK